MRYLIIIMVITILNKDKVLCNLKTDYVDAVGKSDKISIEKEIVNNYTTFKYFTTLMPNNHLNNATRHVDLNKFNERFIEDGGRRGRYCLKNLTKCMVESESSFFLR